MFHWLFKKTKTSPALQKADTAIAMVNDLTNTMRAYSSGNDPVKALMSDLWQHRNNVPFMVTVYEAIQEVKPPT